MKKYDINPKESQLVNMNPMPRTFDFYVLLFFMVSFAGWIWEAGIYFVTEHTLVNRGVYYGPYLPIYGSGGLLLWFVLHRLHQKPLWTFCLSALICSSLEYVTSVFLEWKWGVRWWDYEEHFLNINGRVCFIGAVCFGVGGVLLNCWLLPWYMRLYHRISRKWRLILCGIFLAVFILDVTYCAVYPNSGYGVTE